MYILVSSSLLKNKITFFFLVRKSIRASSHLKNKITFFYAENKISQIFAKEIGAIFVCPLCCFSSFFFLR
jgi:hypothetical protein